MGYYRKHIFFCTNQRENDKKSCGVVNAEEMCDYTKERLRALKQYGKGLCRVSRAGCMGRCKNGPWMVIYPDEIWCTYQTRDDIDRIIETYLV